MLYLRKPNVKAVLLGALVDTVGTLLVATALFVAMSAAGISEAEIAVRLRGASGLALMLILGLGFTLLGGYVAGRAAGQDELLHGALVAGIGLVLGLLFRDTGLPLWYEAAGLLAMLPFGMAGGHIAKQGNANRKTPS